MAPTAADGELLKQVIDFYHQSLLESPEALAYLAKRGLTAPDMIARFRLGHANRTLGYRLPAKSVKAGAELKGRLQQIGILRESGHEHFNGSIVVPVFDLDGSVTEAYARKLRDDLRTGTPLHLYLPGPHKGVWNESALQEHEEIILCEALIDALTFWQAGFHNVTASYGVTGFTPDHLAAFLRHGVKRILIAYDRDEAGDTAAASLAEQLIAVGIDCYRIEFPKGMDANDYALKVTPAAKSLGILIRKAAWMGQGATPQLEPGRHVETMEGTPTALAAEAVPVLPLAASPVVQPATDAIAADIKADEVVFTFGERRYRVRGLPKNLSPETLKINLLVAAGEAYYVDTLDLYSAKGRAHYLLHAAKELAVVDDVIKHDLGRILLKLEALQDERIKAATMPASLVPVMSEVERHAALELLRAPGLLTRIVADFDACGLVGERTNKLVGYLAAVSRKLARPLAIVVQSSSAAGKSSLMDAVLAMMPQEERIKYSAMTGQSLFYMGETNLQHKILAIVEEEGASRASYALKLLQSEGELTIASTGKDAASGNLTTQEHRVTGPVMIFLTTTAIKYLTLIDTVALLHQHQREIKHARGGDGADVEYIEVTLEDIDEANRLTHEVLGRSLDELPPQTRRLLTLVAGMVAEYCAALDLARKDVRFSRKDVREKAGWGDTQLKIHLGRLAELEYLLVHRAERGQGHVYELLYDGDGRTGSHLIGLLDVEALRAYDKRRSGQERSQAAPGRPLVGGWSALGRDGASGGKPVLARAAAADVPFEVENALISANGHAPAATVVAGEA